MVGSREELVDLAIEDIDTSIELHRPFVDDVHIKCSKCGKHMNRVPDVLDCWFDSGAMPFAQYHYPFENKELFESQFPADFIAEGIDQTRGWFYTLLVIGTFVKGCSPYKNVVVNDLVLDKFGGKMHKSRGNAVAPMPILEKYGADATRFFMLHSSPVWTPLKFDEDGIKEMLSKFFNTLKNTYNFFSMYANTDNIDPTTYEVAYDDLEEIDKWLISKYNKLVKNVTESMDEYDLNKVTKYLVEFVSEDLSNWYIRRNRKRFWASELDNSKKAVYKTTYEVLIGVSKLLAPLCPFISDEIYTKLTEEESVHLADYPKYDESLINLNIENRMDLVRDLISMGRNAREDVKIKVRQPISEVLLDGNNEELISDLVPLIKEELNVKEVVFITNLDEYMNFNVKPNFKEVGKVFGPKIKEFGSVLENLSKEEINKLNNDEVITITLAGEEVEVNKNMTDIRISAKEGFDVVYQNNNFIILNTNLTDELIKEGIAREMISKVQNIRKESDFEITDRINLYYSGDELVKDSVKEYEEFIKSETLSVLVEEKENIENSYDLNGHDTYIEVEKNKTA